MLILALGYCAKKSWVVEPRDWSKTNRGFFAQLLSENGIEKIANQIVEQSKATWPRSDLADDLTLIKMKVDLASCIEQEIKVLLAENRDPALNGPSSNEDQETFLKPILQKCTSSLN